jgi:hypothetical protein
MPAFQVDPRELSEHAERLLISEPFGRLAEAASALPALAHPPVTAAALSRLTVRLHHTLVGLSTASESIAGATRVAADDYQAVESTVLLGL